MSVVGKSDIGAFYLNSGGLHLNGKGLRRLIIYVKLKICKLWCELEPVNDGYDKEILDKNTSNLQSQENLTYEFPTLDKVATEDKDTMSSLGNLKLRNVNCLIFGQINSNSIRN